MGITQEQVDYLNKRQTSGQVHPYTCMGGDDGCIYCYRAASYRSRFRGEHVDINATTEGVLIATTKEWVCPCGDYKQEYK